MSTPPAKKIKVESTSGEGDVDAPNVDEECTTISMVVEEGGCVSPIIPIKGYPWRLRLSDRDDGYYKLFVRCEKSMEAELWDCEADIKIKDPQAKVHFKCSSTDKKSQELLIGVYQFAEKTELDVEIAPKYNGDKFHCRPVYGQFEPRDGWLVIGTKKIYVNKESLASQSSFFKDLFDDEHRCNKKNEYVLGGVHAAVFTSLLRMVYGENGTSVVDEVLKQHSARRILTLADTYDLKIVKDGVANWLLSSSCTLDIHERLAIAEVNKKLDIKDGIISQYSDAQLKELSETPGIIQLSPQTLSVLFKKSCDALTKANEQPRG